jgi:hypothetical protein
VDGDKDYYTMIKRLFLLTLLFFIITPPAQASLAVVQAQRNENAAGVAVSVNISPAAGNLLVVMTGQNVSGTATVTMSATGATPTWTQTTSGYVSSSVGSGNHRAAMFYAMNIPASITAVTATWTQGTRTDITVYEISGAVLTSAEDSSVNSTNSVTATSLQSGALTTTNANDILMYGVHFTGGQGVDTAGSPFAFATNGDAGSSSQRTDIAYQIVSSTQSAVTTTTSWTVSTAAESVFAAFQSASGAPPPTGTNKREKLDTLDPSLTQNMPRAILRNRRVLIGARCK